MGSSRPVVVVTGKRRPHEVFLLASSLILGVLFLLGAPRPPSVDHVWFPWWATALAGSGAMALIGCYWRRNLWMALALERAGLLFNACCCFVYAVMVVSHNGWRALFAAWFFASWVVADVVRSLQISNDLRSLGRGIRAAGRRDT